MRILLTAILLLSVSALQAHAQGKYGRNEKLDQLHEQRQKELLEREKEYNDTMRRLRGSSSGPKVENDPWRNVRPAENSTKR